MTELVYSPWKMKDVRRLYVNTVEGEKLGYLDLGTLDVFPESAATEVLLRSALRALIPGDPPLSALA